MTFSRSRYDTQIKLSSEELFEISQEISRKFAPDISGITPKSALLSNALPNHYPRRTFAKDQVKPLFHTSHRSRIQLSPQEMFEISQEISRKFAPNVSTDASELVLLPVDPYHLYAYWNLGEHDNVARSNDESNHPLILRIYWRPDESNDPSNTKIWFDVALHTFRSLQKVRLPIDGTAYSAAIGRLYPDNSLTVVADSNIIHVPCDKIKSSPVQRKKPFSVAESLPTPKRQTLEKAFNVTETLPYDQALPDAGAEGIRYNKNPDKSLSSEKDRDNEMLFFSKLKNMLCEKAINEQFILKVNASETFYYQNKNASGQGR